MTPFTPADVQLLLDTAQSAPLQNMRHAEAVAGVCQRAQGYFQSIFAPAPAAGPVKAADGFPDVLPPAQMPVIDPPVGL